MRIGDKYLKKGSNEIHTVAGFCIYSGDGVCLQTESKKADGVCRNTGSWDRVMKDNDGKEFMCEGFSFGLYTKIIETKNI